MEAHLAISANEEARPLKHPWLGLLLNLLDGRLRLRHGVTEYTRCPNCLFRIQVITSCDDFVLSDGDHVHPGDPLISLHVWNEQFPSFPASGPTLAWARRFNRAFDTSLRDLAHFLEARRDLDDVKAVCANMAFASTKRSAQLTRFVSRFGFEKIAANSSQSLRQRMHWLGENILISMIVLAHNATALRADTLWRDRTLVFLSCRTLRRRYGFVRDSSGDWSSSPSTFAVRGLTRWTREQAVQVTGTKAASSVGSSSETNPCTLKPVFRQR